MNRICSQLPFLQKLSLVKRGQCLTYMFMRSISMQTTCAPFNFGNKKQEEKHLNLTHVLMRRFGSNIKPEEDGFSDFENNSPKQRQFNNPFESARTKSLLGKDIPFGYDRLKPANFKEETSQSDPVDAQFKNLVDLMNKDAPESFSDFEDEKGIKRTHRPPPEISQNDLHTIDITKEDEVKKEEEERESSGVYLQSSDTLFPKEEYESTRQKEEKQAEARFGDYSDNLVRRPKKGFLWGLGTKTFDDEENKSEFFEFRKLPTIKQIIHFLEVHQARDIKAVDLRNYKSNHLPKFAILGNCFSSRHLHKVGKALCSEVKKLKCEEIINQPKVMGRKDEPWILVMVKEIGVFLFLPDVREEIDIEGKWFNEVTKEMWDQFNLGKMRKNRG